MRMGLVWDPRRRRKKVDARGVFLLPRPGGGGWFGLAEAQHNKFVVVTPGLSRSRSHSRSYSRVSE